MKEIKEIKTNENTVTLHIEQKGFAFTVESDRIITDEITCEQCGTVTGIEYPGYLVTGYRIGRNRYHVECYESARYEDGFMIHSLKLKDDITVKGGYEALTKEVLEALHIIRNYYD